MQHETAQFTTPGGIALAYQSIGAGPPVVLANGLGGTFHTWRHLYGHLAARFRVLSWDYRGLHGSAPPADRSQVAVPYHVDDLQALLDHLGIGRALFVGWSMGVQVNFELYRRQPQRFAGIAAINGTAGKPFETIVGQRFFKHLLPPILLEAKRRAEGVNKLAQVASSWGGLITILKQTGLVAQSLDEQVFADLVVEFGQLDFGLYSDTLRILGEHDAWDVLPTIRVPTTIITGDRDVMTPVEAASKMSQIIADARLLVLPDCTHYAPVERPDAINDAMDALIERCGPW